MDKDIKILIVEDEALIAEGLACCLRALGYTVAAQLENGIEAFEFIRNNDVDCVIIDINMPELDGISAVERINQVKDIPCVFITGYSDNETILRASKAGAYGYLTKPIDESDLEAVINVAFMRHQEKRHLDNKVDQMKKEVEMSRKLLEERKLIEQAKSVLERKFNFNDSDAMSFIRKKSRDNNRKLVDIAKEIIKIDMLVDF